MRYRAVIFDLDGTLLDTLEDLADSMNEALHRAGLPGHPVDAYRFFVGTGIANLVKKAAPEGAEPALCDKILASMNEVYSRNWAKKTRPYRGIPELLAELSQAGVKLAVLSNKPDVFTQIMVRHFFPGEMFGAVKGMTAEIPRKPDPAGALLLAENLGVRPEEAAYCGDSDTDMKTGLAAGMFTLGVTWGFRPVAELRGAGAMALAERPEDILRLLRENKGETRWE